MRLKEMKTLIFTVCLFLSTSIFASYVDGGFGTLDDILDVDTTNASNNEVLTYSSGTWTVLNGPQFVGGTNTFSITNGTASLDVAAGATLDVNANLNLNSNMTVSGATSVNQNLLTTGNPTFASVTTTTVVNISANQKLNLEGVAGDTYFIFNSADGEVELFVNGILVGEWK